MGLTACAACPSGQRQPLIGQRECTLCEPGTYSPPGWNSTGCLACGQSEGATPSRASPGAEAMSCPHGVLRGVRSGFWSAVELTTLNAHSTAAYRCLHASHCLGGVRSACADGHTGPLCSRCLPGFFERGTECDACPGVNASAPNLTAATIAIVENHDNARVVASVVIILSSAALSFVLLLILLAFTTELSLDDEAKRAR